ncbi:hypothetical protein Pelo_8846 [Pelomyxa schiedti]|nr:hypothetical protein Pelo_8846 [Pelomyxa schiedti]
MVSTLCIFYRLKLPATARGLPLFVSITQELPQRVASALESLSSALCSPEPPGGSPSRGYRCIAPHVRVLRKLAAGLAPQPQPQPQPAASASAAPESPALAAAGASPVGCGNDEDVGAVLAVVDQGCGALAALGKCAWVAERRALGQLALGASCAAVAAAAAGGCWERLMGACGEFVAVGGVGVGVGSGAKSRDASTKLGFATAILYAFQRNLGVPRDLVGVLCSIAVELMCGNSEDQESVKGGTRLCCELMKSSLGAEILAEHERVIVDGVCEAISCGCPGLFTMVVKHGKIMPLLLEEATKAITEYLATLSEKENRGLGALKYWDIHFRDGSNEVRSLTHHFVAALVSSLEKVASFCLDRDGVIASSANLGDTNFIVSVLTALTWMCIGDSQAHTQLIDCHERHAPISSPKDKVLSILVLIPVSLVGGQLKPQLARNALTLVFDKDAVVKHAALSLISTKEILRQMEEESIVSLFERGSTLLLAGENSRPCLYLLVILLQTFPKLFLHSEGLFNVTSHITAALLEQKPPGEARLELYHPFIDECTKTKIKEGEVPISEFRLMEQSESCGGTKYEARFVTTMAKVIDPIDFVGLVMNIASHEKRSNLMEILQRVFLEGATSTKVSVIRACFVQSPITVNRDWYIGIIQQQQPKLKDGLFYEALALHNVELVQFLLSSAVNMNPNALIFGEYPLAVTSLFTYDDKCIQLLLDRGADPNLSKKNILRKLVENGMDSTLSLFLKHGAHVSSDLLTIAVRHRKHTTAELLWFHGLVLTSGETFSASESSEGDILDDDTESDDDEGQSRSDDGGTDDNCPPNHFSAASYWQRYYLPATWLPARHKYFPHWFRCIIKTILLCWAKNSATATTPRTFGSLPKSAVYTVLMFLSPCYFSPENSHPLLASPPSPDIESDTGSVSSKAGGAGDASDHNSEYNADADDEWDAEAEEESQVHGIPTAARPGACPDSNATSLWSCFCCSPLFTMLGIKLW